ncbi:S1 family peptidase [Microvirga arsenatis]|uniref:Trypsin-like serine protease n=1 Tax=Microvirga arsenatis TaxID=2692265 RepID=A0ABW9Z108_9HYPH|nr:trypsin-like serine protease [Microvirga arsenatis]NBJ11503.1 trypsin-like serine protease [Microvirga arsenatis]NBJ26341.1 trypsin-like serine protease [Microvirga arsenatis]
MRALPLLALAVLTLLASPAWAVLQGVASRDPDGLRRSVVSIENSLGELCSGVIVGPDLVLTAAHCVIDRAAYRVVALNRAFRPQRFAVAALAIHPTFVPGTTPRTQPGVDLAVVKLDRPLGPDYLALDPTQAGRIDVGDPVTIAGFGVLSERLKRTARTLRQTNLVSLGPVEVANRVLIVVDRNRLAETAGAGACRGDSGGPILAATAAGYQLYGITSWSSGAMRTRQPSACGGLTAVTPIVEHLGWIVSSMRGLGSFNSAWTRN